MSDLLIQLHNKELQYFWEALSAELDALSSTRNWFSDPEVRIFVPVVMKV